MTFNSNVLRTATMIVALGLCLAAAPAAEAADDAVMVIKARAVSTMNISRAASDMIDIQVSRWSSVEQRESLLTVLAAQGNPALADALKAEEDAGWVRFDPRGGGGPGRGPGKTMVKYSRLIDHGDVKEVTLITPHYIGYGTDPRAADGSKLTDYPVSFVLLKLHQDDKGNWTGVGRMFVGAKVRFDMANGKFVIDEFPMDPVYLKDVKVK